MRLKPTITITITTIAAVAVIGYGAYRGLLYGRQFLQERFAEIHDFASTDGDNSRTGFENGLTQQQIEAREDTTAPVLSSGDIIPWSMLSKAKMAVNKKGGKEVVEPHYSDGIKALNGKTVSIKGFIFPLEQSGKQTHFLLSPFPPSCPYCLPAGPSQLIEVWMKSPVKFTYGAITVKGRFEILEKQDEIKSGMFYRMRDGVKE